MGAHINITSLLGITLGTGAQADDVQQTDSVDLDELISQATGEFIKADTINYKKTDVVVTGDGPATLTDVTAGVIATPSDIEVINVKLSEAPNKRCNFTITAAGHAAFTDPAGTILATGAEPTIADLRIKSVEYSIAESVDREYGVDDLVLLGTNGNPVNRAKAGVKGSFTVNGRGDLPAGTALGTGGAAFTGGEVGKIVVGNLMTGEKRKDWNRWSAAGGHYKAAA